MGASDTVFGHGPASYSRKSGDLEVCPKGAGSRGAAYACGFSAATKNQSAALWPATPSGRIRYVCGPGVTKERPLAAIA